MVQQPIPPTPVDPHDDNVEDDSLLRPITAPPERDRAQAKYGDAEPGDDLQPEVSQTMATGDASGSGLPIMPLAIVAIIVVALLLWWLI